MDDTRTGYLAAEDFLPQLLVELEGCEIEEVRARLVVARGPARPAAWAANVWFDLQRLPIASIGDAARQLRAIQRNWTLPPTGHFRRAALIAESLPPIRQRPHVFPQPQPSAPLGAWTLWEPDMVYAAARCASAFPHGAPVFAEDREGPPNRAYLKLWEALTVLGRHPQPGETCLDLGASPGGWTWVLAKLGARVVAVDKAPLDPRIAAMAGVEQRQESAFGLAPASVGPVDWLFSDIICYPARLLELVARWRETGLARNMVCTLKFQAETDHATARAFAAIPGSRLMHLHHNKHELTWALLA
ncbi:MAG: SAM-dependent methyltransferase [bacterium]